MRRSRASARHVRRRVGAAAGLLGVVLATGSGCRAPRPPIRVEGRTVIVENQGDHAWFDVEVWVNDHYRVTARTIPRRGRLVAPLDTFVAGFGQRFRPDRHPVRGIAVTAQAADGRAVTLTWGTGRRR